LDRKVSLSGSSLRKKGQWKVSQPEEKGSKSSEERHEKESTGHLDTREVISLASLEGPEGRNRASH